MIFFRRLLLATMLLFAPIGANAQVTVGSDALPQATLDVVATKTDGSTAEGVIAPRLTLAQLKAADARYLAAQTGAIVYVTDATGDTTTKTANVTAAGYYYFDGTVWQKMGGVVAADMPDTNTTYTISAGTGAGALTLTPSTGAAQNVNVNVGVTSVTGTAPVNVSTGNTPVVSVTTGNLTSAASVATATAPLTVGTGTSRLVGGGATLAVNNTAPLWNANQLRGTGIATTAPTTNQVLKYNGSNWAPAADANTTYTATAPVTLTGTAFGISSGTSSNFFTPASGFTVTSQSLAYWGKVVSLQVVLKMASARGIAASGNFTDFAIGTVNASYHPAVVMRGSGFISVSNTTTIPAGTADTGLISTVIASSGSISVESVATNGTYTYLPNNASIYVNFTYVMQ